MIRYQNPIWKYHQNNPRKQNIKNRLFRHHLLICPLEVVSTISGFHFQSIKIHSKIYIFRQRKRDDHQFLGCLAACLLNEFIWIHSRIYSNLMCPKTGRKLVSPKMCVKEAKKSRNSFPCNGFRLLHEKLMCLFIYDFSPTTKANQQKKSSNSSQMGTTD